MTLPAPPYSQNFDLFTLSESGQEIRVAPPAVSLARIAEWAGLAGLERFEAVVRVARNGDNNFRYVARLEAETLQHCVVTMVPIRGRIAEDVHRSFYVVPRRTIRTGTIDLAKDDPEDLETVDSPIIDLAAPLLEELVLAVDPYPRAPGVRFQPPVDPATPLVQAPEENPFAVLALLKSMPASPAGADLKPGKIRKKPG